MNRNDYQSGWDTDQFPNNVPEVMLAYYEILKGGGFSRGGTNFDAKLRRQSLDPEDLILSHVGAMDVCARALKSAAALLEDEVSKRHGRKDTLVGKTSNLSQCLPKAHCPRSQKRQLLKIYRLNLSPDSKNVWKISSIGLGKSAEGAI